jgi:DNA-directed RNA polymerase specialized sigma24 family protein
MSEKIRRFAWRKAGTTAAADLLRECGEKLTDRALWTQFQERFQGLIFLYLMRALRLGRIQDDVADLVPDLAQEVYLKLVQHDGRVLRGFRGTTEFSVMAFLARVSSSVVQDHQRAANSGKRHGQVVPIESLRDIDQGGIALHGSPASDSPFNTILRLIDIEKVIQEEPDRKNARRNALIVKLHFLDEFQASEIAQFPGFGLTKSGVETIIARFRKRFES